MNYKHIVGTALLATVGLLIAARPSDILTDLHLTPKTMQDISLRALTSDYITVPRLPAEARQWATGLPPSARVQAVQALGQLVRRYTTTADFRNRYDKWARDEYQVSQSQPEEISQTLREQESDSRATHQQLVAQSTQAFEKLDPTMLRTVLQSQLEGALEALPTAEGEEKARLKAEVAQLQSLQASSRSNPTEFKKQYLALLSQKMNQEVNREVDKQEQNRAAHQQNTANYQKRLAEYKANANPNFALKKKLREFISLTESVDFDAKVLPQGYQREFVNPAYRSKPNDWKLLYRMGRESVMAARAFAQSWLQDLS